MTKIAKVLIGALAALGLYYAAMLLLFFGATGVPGCTIYPVMDVPSPASDFRATVENRACPHESMQTTVYVSKGGISSSVFIAPSATQSAGTYAPIQLRLAWQGNSTLQIRYPRGLKFNSRVDNAEGVRITYVETDASMP